jgi:hypothetical protein
MGALVRIRCMRFALARPHLGLRDEMAIAFRGCESVAAVGFEPTTLGL